MARGNNNRAYLWWLNNTTNMQNQPRYSEPNPFPNPGEGPDLIDAGTYNVPPSSNRNNWLAPLVSAAGDIFSTLFGSRTQRRNVDRTNQANRELAQYEHEKNVEMWHMQNAYNTPEAQMERFRDAGLSPHLMYGQGTPGNAQQMPEYNAPRMDYSYTPEVDPGSMIQAYQNAAQYSHGIELTQKQIQNEAARNWLTHSQTQESISRTNLNRVQEHLITHTLQHEIDYSLQRSIYQTARANIAKKEAEWARYGIRMQDAIWIRVTIEALKLLGASDESIKNLVPSGFDINMNQPQQ